MVMLRSLESASLAVLLRSGLHIRPNIEIPDPKNKNKGPENRPISPMVFNIVD